ncbi:hypothetical protein MASR2M18_17510 [Ignavibacteria bacterium]|nr:RecQ family ATP-dependent DNA helicase [Bacteroidota bacterium]MCZ2133455.1 RecQ family ATP-dependent DNA helicase [Bacteroidota bacterium]
MSYSSDAAHEILQKHFGYASFRAGQEDIIRSVAERHDVIAVMPTGGGKSLCYQIPAMLCDGIALVVSPLIALMQDQVDALIRARIPAAFINSLLSQEEITNRLIEARAGRLRLLYIAPERLDSTSFLNELRLIRPSFLAVDEAHCISEWGHDFRPSYLQIPRLFKAIGRIPVIALTATATNDVRMDIARHLELRRPKVFVRGFDRPNLAYYTETTQNKAERICDILDETPNGSTIIYCASRKRAENFAERIREYRRYALVYHAGLSDAHRNYAQEEFLSGNCKILAATSAFGMGIDKSDVRNVIHCDLTLTLEAYYQEAGRAGRDGLPSRCIMLYQPADRRLMEFFIRSAYPEREQIRIVYETLYEITGTPVGAKPNAPILLDSRQIAARTQIPEISVSAIMSLFELNGITRLTKAQPFATVQFTASHERLKEYFHNTTADRQKALSALLRSVGAQALSGPAEIDMPAMYAKHDITPDVFEPAVRALEYARLLRFHQPGKDGGLALALERMPFEQTPIDLEALERRRSRAFQKLDVVERYATTAECKRNFILSYFESSAKSGNCGACSSCIAVPEHKTELNKREEFLLQIILSASSELDGRFGKTALSDMILGEKSRKIKNYRLDELQTFGQAKGFSREETESIIEYALASRLLRYGAELYPVISLTEDGVRRAVTVYKPIAAYRSAYSEPPSDLLARLLELRENYAMQDDIRADALADDDALAAIALAAPTTLGDLSAIHEVNAAFVARCGHGVIEAVRSWRLAEENRAAAQQISETAANTLAMLRRGKSIQQISEERDLAPTTIAMHIEEAAQAGADFSGIFIVSDELSAAVGAEIRRNPVITLKDLRSIVGAKYGYPELRAAAAVARQKSG